MTVDQYDRVLAGMDPASGVVPRRDPDALLDDILRTGTEPAPRKTRPMRPGLRVALVVAAVAALVVAIPFFGGGQSAYAGWTAYPAALSTGQQSVVARRCKEWTEESITKSPTQVVLSERRGGIGLALLSGPGGLLVTCQQVLGGSGEPSGGSSETYLTDIPARYGILSDGGSGFSEDDGEPIYRVVSGRVGDDVTGVVVHTAEQGDVIASVEGGYFTAWWPGPAESASRPTASLPMDFTFTAQLRDGTTRNLTRGQTQPHDPPSIPSRTLTATPEQVVRAYADAVHAGDCTTAEALVADPSQSWCGNVDITALTVTGTTQERKATETGDGPMITRVWVSITPKGGDGSMPDGEQPWSYLLDRTGPSGAWRIYDQGLG